ncbi:MAG: hypothetical protein QGG36_19835 [Pirellulaceae bacterium]|jgi:hypothetical protein|nr:hypothetical protein [Pirellulaceae bacterium]MDP7018065.1 hypothetical protein [Pirellulaceae bacterium]
MKHPDRPNPLRDRSGPNPFADSAGGHSPTGVDPGESPYSVSADVRPVEEQYELTAPHRGERLLWAGICLLVLSLLGVFVAPLGLLTAVVSVVVALIARQDLIAIRRGGMDPAGRSKTRRALVVTMFAIVCGLAAFTWVMFQLDWNA